MTQFDINKYSDKYYRRHFVEYKQWENAIGEHIVKILSPGSILDLGCGVGSYLEGSLKGGCKDILGVEISFDIAQLYFVDAIKPYIQKGDATSDLKFDRTFDCVMSIEVAEHIEPDGTGNFINNLTKLSSKYIILAAAPPGQVGTGHINLRDKQFWIEQIISKGFMYRDDIIELCISAWKDMGAPWYILRNLMIFKKVCTKEVPTFLFTTFCSEIIQQDAYMLRHWKCDFFDYIIDIGANIGIFVNYAHARHPNAKIFAYEPCKEAIANLIDNCGFIQKCIFEDKAMGDGSDMNFYGLQMEISYFVKPDELESPNNCAVNSISLSNIFKQHNIPLDSNYFIKIDCEGGERFLLNDNDCIEIIKKSCGLSMEIHFTPVGVKIREWDSVLRAWDVYNSWIYNNFHKTHRIIYYKSNKRRGNGIYILTRKDMVK